MSVGVIIPNSGRVAAEKSPISMAKLAEDAGAQGLWVSDHLLMVDTPVDYYPYSDDGHLTWDVTDNYLESLVCCAAMAAATSNAVVGPAVMILPQRNVLQVAKEVATIDLLSRGRFILGVGSGWNVPEMESLGYAFKGRTRRFEEQLHVLSTCWSGRPSPFEGDHVRVPADVVLFPTPINPDGMPVLVGGMAPPALRRAALAGGWMGIAAAHRWDLESMTGAMRTYRAACAEVDARPRPVLKLHSSPDDLPLVSAIARTALEDLGFLHVIVEPPWELGDSAAVDMIGSLAEFYADVPLTTHWNR